MSDSLLLVAASNSSATFGNPASLTGDINLLKFPGRVIKF